MNPGIPEFGQQMRSARHSLRLRQNELAELAGVSERFVRDVESGKLTVRLDKVAAVADVLGFDVTLLARGTRR